MSSPSSRPPSLRVFLSYASEQHELAEQIALALKNSGHDVFFDRISLPAGGDYNANILGRIRSSDLMIFLISPASVDKGRYTQTELRFAQEIWPSPKGNVLPVMAVSTSYEQIPNYLKAVSILQPAGSIAAEVAAAANDLALGWTPEDAVAGQGRSLKKIRLRQQVADLDNAWQLTRKPFPPSRSITRRRSQAQMHSEKPRIP